MKQYDKNTIEYLGIPGPVLMERAALAAEDFLKERFDAVKERTKVLIFAGMGNNGGDGLALARDKTLGYLAQNSTVDTSPPRTPFPKNTIIPSRIFSRRSMITSTRQNSRNWALHISIP